MKKTSLLMTLLVLAVIASISIAPVGAQEDEITLRFTLWAAGSFEEIFQGFADEYTAAHPNINVEFVVIPFDEYSSAIVTQQAGNEPFDAGWAVETAATEWVDGGLLADLGPSLRANEAFTLGDFAPGPMKIWTKEDAVYGLPFSTAPFLVVFNIDLFEEAGLETPDVLAARGEWTWETFAETAKAIVDANPTNYGYIGTHHAIADLPLTNVMPVIWAYGGDAWSEDGSTCMLNQAGAVEGLSLMQRMMVDDQSIAPLGDMTNFDLGNAGMMITQLGVLPQFVDVNWGIAPVPSGPDGAVPVVGQAALVVFEGSPHPQEAADLVAWFMNEENVARLTEFFPPARTSVIESDAMFEYYPDIDPDQLRIATIDPILTGRVVPSHPHFAEINQVLISEFVRVWNGEDVQSVMDDICQNIQPFLTEPAE